jgi:hypothetical protein
MPKIKIYKLQFENTSGLTYKQRLILYITTECPVFLGCELIPKVG